MDSLENNTNDKHMEETSNMLSMIVDAQEYQTTCPNRQCAICGAKAIGINFGAPTCAPCKAFFRRNARRKEVLETQCQHHDTDTLIIDNDECSDKAARYSQIRRCSSCRIRRCFDMGMKAELVRTDEENERHKKLVDTNRRRRELLRQKHHEKQLSIPQVVTHPNQLLRESDWRHLSNIVSSYEENGLKTYIQQRSTIFMNGTAYYQKENIPMKHYTALPLCLTMSISSFLRSLPAFHSLSNMNRNYLFKTNLRSLIFLNMFELNQSCFSEPWQASIDKATWELMCGPELYQEFVWTEKLAEKTLIADPIITRLLLIILFCSSSLFCFYDSNVSIKIPKKKTSILEIQNAYVTLLWNYLLHRYGAVGAVKVYSNLIHVYLKMQTVGFHIGVQVRTRSDLLTTHETLNQIAMLDIRDSQN